MSELTATPEASSVGTSSAFAFLEKQQAAQAAPQAEVETMVEQTEPEKVVQKQEAEAAQITQQVEQNVAEVSKMPEKTETKAEAKQPEVSTDDNWLSENSVNTTTETPAEPAGPSEAEKAKMLDGLMNNPQLKALINGLAAGKSYNELVQSTIAVDYANMELQAITEHYGKLQKWEAEKIESAVAELESMGPFQQSQLKKQMLSELNEEQQGRLEKSAGIDKEQVIKRQAEEARIEQKFSSDVQAEVARMQEKDLLGVKITKEEAEGFVDWVNNPNYTHPDGTINVPMLRNRYIGQVLLPRLQSAWHKKGKTEGIVEVLNEVHRPNESSLEATRIPEVKPPPSDQEAAKNITKQAFGSGRPG